MSDDVIHDVQAGVAHDGVPDFKDHFSVNAEAYGRFRPDYPDTLFAFLATVCGGNDLVWDCATGNGQAARHFKPYFKKIVATDASPQQINEAAASGIEFRVAPAEESEIDAASVDLVTVAQAAHWFDMPRFNDEAKRVLKPGGVIALWSYGLMEIEPAIDRVVGHLYQDLLGGYWPPERRHVETGYRDLPFPFRKLAVPTFAMRRIWSLRHLQGYLGTWSAVKAFREATGDDPLELVEAELAFAWGETPTKEVRWPLTLLVGLSA